MEGLSPLHKVVAGIDVHRMLHVITAHFIKHVPGRKTDMCDSEWLAVLARFGLVRGSFIPPKDLRELRLVSRFALSPANSRPCWPAKPTGYIRH